MKRVVIGITDSRLGAEDLVDRLRRIGVPPGDISVLLPDQAGSQDFAHEHHTKAPEAAVAGVAAGGVIGGTLGLLAGIGALAIPGLGPLIAAGPLMAALSGAAGGAAIGGLAGALVGMGIPEYEAKHYEGKVRSGGVLVAAHVETAEAKRFVVDAMKDGGATDVSVTGEASVPHAASRTA